MSRNFKATVKENRPVHPHHNLMTLSVSSDMPEPYPGQFFMIEVNRGRDPLLKRAFSLFRKSGNDLQILYRIRGRGTELLGVMKEGTCIDMIGPLGNRYPVPMNDSSTPIIIAGGIGIASVYPLVEQLAGRALVFYGARTKDDLLMLDEVRAMAREIHVSTDDGSTGQKGTIADSLVSFLSGIKSEDSGCRIYACGPNPLLKAVSNISVQHRIRAFVSMEEHMACGVGACLGCVVKTKGGYVRVCKEGPVLDASEIIW